MTLKIGSVKLENNLILAPLFGVNCTAFRLLCKKHGAGLVFTPMIHPESLLSEGYKIDLIKEERPVVAQIVGKDPEKMSKAAKILQEYADIIDINLGCPDQKVLANQCGAFFSKHPEQMVKMVKAVVDSVSCPVTAKIRTGWDEKTINAVEVAKKLESLGVAAISVHGRTRKQGYSGTANLDIIRQVKDAVKIPVIANGDVFKPKDYINILKKTNCDFVMVGRGSIGDPQIFENCINHLNKKPIIQKTPKFAYELFVEFLEYYEKYMQRYNFSEIRQHAMWFARGLKGASKLKNQLSRAKSVEEIQKILKENIK